MLTVAAAGDFLLLPLFFIILPQTVGADARSAEIRTQYDYDEDSGLLNYVTDAGGVRTTYAYDHATKAMTMASTSVDGQNNSVAYGYTNRLLTAITHNGFEYRFDYDGFGRQTKITAGGHLLASNAYTLTDTTTVTTTYATGEAVTVTTDRHQEPIKKTYTNEGGTVTIVENEYDELGKIVESVDSTSDIVYTYTYDRRGNVVNETRNGSTFKAIEYDESNRLTKTTVTTSDETLVYTPVYETDSDGAIYPDNTLKGMILSGVFEETVSKDEHQRPTHHSLTVGNAELIGTSYGYLTVNNRLTGLVESVYLSVNGILDKTLRYEYDNNGNITAVYQQNELLAQYTYDGLNRLIRENNFALGKTYTFAYDAAGNILCKRTYAVTSGAVVTPIETKDYVYDQTGWKDRLVSYDGTAISYDSLGNPTSYRGHTLVWDRVRLLKQWDNITFDYNANGIRTRKGNTTYELDGNNIISETTNGNTIRYYYGNGGIVGFRYNNAYYYYEKNLQGDIIGIYTAAGTLVGAYTYDAWGNCTVTTDTNGIAAVNPFRYRGYYFDADTSLYYVSKRYYDSEIGRWISPEPNIELGEFDENAGMFAYNGYVYCADNPIMFADVTGESLLLTVALSAGIGALIGTASQIICNVIDRKPVKNGLIKSAITGAVGGALIALFPSASTSISAGMSAVESIISDIENGENILTMLVNATLSVGFAVATGGGTIFGNRKIAPEIFKSIGKLLPGNHPKVKKMAKKFLKDTLGDILDEIKTGILDGLFVNYINRGTQWLFGLYTGSVSTT